MCTNFLKLNEIFFIPLLGLFMVSITLFSCSNNEEVAPDPVVPNPAISNEASDIIKAMAAGFNLGNTFDNGLNSTSVSSIKPIIDLYYNAGMRHIRIPVTWMDRFDGNTLADENGNINFSHSRFLDLKATIDYALEKENMYVVINAHHEHWLKDYYDGSSTFDDPFYKLWSEIANHFKDYPNRLIFEVLNEPEGTMGEWSGGFPQPTNGQALSYTRQINKVGYDAIRETGGSNETRIIMVAPNGQGNHSMLDDVYPTKSSLPGGGNDKYLAVQVHSYDPCAFCGQDGSNSAYPGNSSFINKMLEVIAHAQKLGVPINYGEFGVGRAANTAERNTDIVRGYYHSVAKTTLDKNMSYSVWDDRGWFGLINSGGTTFINNIVPTMMAQ